MKYIIIGAVAGGASAAARLRRLDEHAEIIIFEKGEYISYANCGLPYYIGDVIKQRDKLFVQTAASFTQRFKIDVRINTEVINIDSSGKKITAHNLQTNETYCEEYDKLILSPGAEPIRPPLPGIDLEGIFTLRNVSDTDFIKNYITKRKSGNAVVVGGGFIGLEMAENLVKLGMNVSIVEAATQILAPLDYPMAAIVQQHLHSKGVNLKLSTSVTGFSKIEDKLKVNLSNNESLFAEIVILSIGVRPDTKLALRAQLQLGPAKGIAVNQYLQTSHPDIYAVGDAIEFINPITGQSMNTYLAGPANKQGRIAANNIVLGNHDKYAGAINTAIVKVFDLTIATAGTASKHLTKSNIAHRLSTIHAASHATYYPNAEQLHIQLAFSPDTGTLFNAQVVGKEGVDKRIELFSTVIKRNGTVEELTALEHAYAPPFSSAKDPVNIAGYVAENILRKRMVPFYVDQIQQLQSDDILIDVRSNYEFSRGTIPTAINIPVDELRARLHELPSDKKIYLFCEVGQRGYLAQRILMQSGYQHVYNLSGGYYTYKTTHLVNSEEQSKVFFS